MGARLENERHDERPPTAAVGLRPRVRCPREADRDAPARPDQTPSSPRCRPSNGTAPKSARGLNTTRTRAVPSSAMILRRTTARPSTGGTASASRHSTTASSSTQRLCQIRERSS
jgi:hypothetical protein